MNEEGKIAYFASQEIAKAHGYGIPLTMEQAQKLLALDEADRALWYQNCKDTNRVQPIPEPTFGWDGEFTVKAENNPTSIQAFQKNFHREMNEAGIYIKKPYGVGATIPGSSSFKKRKPKVDSRNNGGGKRTGKNGNKPNKAH